MKYRILDGFLIIAILVGGVLAWQTGRERSRLTDRHERLAKTAGELPITDPSKVYCRSLDTGEPLHFAWRLLPAELPEAHRQRRRRTQHVGVQSAIRIHRPRAVSRGRPGRHASLNHFGDGSSRSTVWDKELTEFLRSRWDKVRIEQLGKPDVTVLGPDQPAVILRLTLPEELPEETLKSLSDRNQKRLVAELYELHIGPMSP